MLMDFIRSVASPQGFSSRNFQLGKFGFPKKESFVSYSNLTKTNHSFSFYNNTIRPIAKVSSL